MRVICSAIGLIIAAILGLSSCYTQNKAFRQFDKVKRHYPLILTDYCATTFKSDRKDSIVKGDIVRVTDTFYMSGDSVDCPPDEHGKALKVPCPPYRTIIDSFFRIDTFFKDFPETMAKMALIDGRYDSLRSELIAAKAENKGVKKRSDKSIVMNIILFAVIVGYGSWKFFK